MKGCFVFDTYPLVRNIIPGRTTCAGFYDLETLFMFFAASVMLARKQFDDIVIITDKIGYELLEPLEFHNDYKIYSDLHEAISDYERCFWPISKIKVPLYMDEPYLLIDYDLLIWDSLQLMFNKRNDIITECPEFSQYIYRNSINDYICYGKKDVLPCLTDYIKTIDVNHNFRAINCGIVGGYDLNFLKEYSNDISMYLKEYSQKKSIPTHIENAIFLEQFFLLARAKYYKKRLVTLYDFFGERSKEKYAHYNNDNKSNKGAKDFISHIINEFFEEYNNKIKDCVDLGALYVKQDN